MAWYNPFSWGDSNPTQDAIDRYNERLPLNIRDQVNAGFGLTNQMAPMVNPRMQDQFRVAQMDQLQKLQGIASGQMAGAGELGVNRQINNALAAQQAQARMARGPNSALAYRNAARNTAGLGLSGAGLAQQAAMQDQMGAQGLMANVAQQGRQQDIGLATQNAQNTLQQRQLNNQMRQAMIQNLLQQQGAVPKDSGWLGPALGAAGQIGTAIALSDERVKTDIADADDDVDAMLDSLRAKRYRYKNEARHGAGERVGIMAQDLERSRAGSRVVVDVPDGKAIDLSKAVSAALAATARLNARLRAVEGKAG